MSKYSYYYTFGYKPKVWKYKQDKWILVIRYHTRFDKNVKPETAKSNSQLFQNVDIPTTFDSIEHAKSYSAVFHDHVEQVVRGSKKKQRHVETTSPSTNTIGIERTNRTRKRVGAVKIGRIFFRQRASRKDGNKNREEWQ